MSPYVFVDQDVKTYTGSEAEKALRNISDEKFLTDADGIVKVPRDRWEAAQKYECRTWMTLAAHSTEDRNHDHFSLFDSYNALNAFSFEHAIELGCGPFTNLKFIWQSCAINKCSLLDPLAEQYLNHRNCNYTSTFLRCEESALSKGLSKTKAHRAIRRVIRKVAPRLLYSTLPVEALISKPIEEMIVGAKYDLIVMINVIEHCYDVNSIFEKIEEMASDGAVIVFHDKYYYHSQVSQQAKAHYDAGHPLRVDRNVVDGFLNRLFTPLLRKVVRIEDAENEYEMGYDAIYFIGKRRSLKSPSRPVRSDAH